MNLRLQEALRVDGVHQEFSFRILHHTMFRSYALVLLSAIAMLPVALSGAEVVALDKFVVTAQKRTEEIKNVPIAVTAYTGDFLSRLGVGSFKDLAPYVPGLFIQEQSPNNPGINVRGVTTDSGNPSQETRVSIFQDGVSISRSRGSVVELFDLERVEVLKGPQGTLFGRGAQIGAVSLIQNKAQNATLGQFTAGFGNLGKIEAAGTYNTVLAPNQLFARVAFSYVDREGSIENVADGSDLNGKNTLGIRTSLRWQPTPATTADLIVNYQRDQPPGTAFKSGTFAPRGGNTRPFDTAELNRGEELRIDRTVVGLTGIVNHDINDALTVTSITGYRDFDSFEAFDADGTRLNILEFAEVARHVRIPLATGERLTTKTEFGTLLRAGGVKILQPALGRLGGIMEAKKLSAIAEIFNAEMAPHLYAGPVEWAANIHLAVSIPNLLMAETIQKGGDFHLALIKHTLKWEDGYIIPPEGPGLGIEFDEDLARAHAYTGTGLHLQMQEAPCDYRHGNRFEGGAPAPSK